MLDLKRQYESIKDEIAAAIERVLASQHFIGGPELEGLSASRRNTSGVRAHVGCASGTDALWLALRALRSPEENISVITTPFQLLRVGELDCSLWATPILADIDPGTLNLDPAKVENALKRGRSQNIRAVMPVHPVRTVGRYWSGFGQLAQALWGRDRWKDAAQAFGAAWKGKKAGTLGKAAGFSFLSHEKSERMR